MWGIEIQKLYDLLKSKGFEIANHLLEKGMDYSHINDFRDHAELSTYIVEHDLRHVDMADFLVVVANGPKLWDRNGDGGCQKCRQKNHFCWLVILCLHPGLFTFLILS
jgi:hypothetical protein